jgi:alanyl-tRNA synthetase
VTIPDFSVELCGGTHVRSTGDIGPFFITEESGVSAGVRRIKAVTGLGAYDYARTRLTQFDGALGLLGARPEGFVETLSSHLATESKLRKEVQQLKTKLAVGGGGESDDRVDIKGVTFIARRVEGTDKESLRALADALKSKLKTGIVFLAAPSPEGRVAIIASVTPDLTQRTPAGQLVKQLAPIVGGAGGGRPDFAEAGGKDASKINELLTASRLLVEELLAAP